MWLCPRAADAGRIRPAALFRLPLTQMTDADTGVAVDCVVLDLAVKNLKNLVLTY